MVRVAILLAEGFEETEALVPADLLARAGAEILFVSVHGEETVVGAHGFGIKSHCALTELSKTTINCLFLPGGAKGTELLGENFIVQSLIQYAVDNGIYVAAICAAPSILGKMGLLEGRRYACYPGFEKEVIGGIRTGKKVEHDDIFLTGEGMGASFQFGFRLVELLFGSETARSLKEQTRYE